ncbi:MAG TPA: hypothetical protein VFO70_01390, partial [Chitinophagaceae bacterium]|nr:hypothetical protein [Chitinophagaceae bacterium]
MKLSLKINLLFTLIVSGILLVMSISIYNISRNNVLDEFRQRLKNRAARTAYLYDALKADTTNLMKSLDAASPAALVNKNINIYDESGQLLYEYHDENTQPLDPDTSWFRESKGKEQAYFSVGKKDVCLFNS